VGLAVLVSGALFALGNFPANHPIVPLLHFRLSGPGGTGSAEVIRPTGRIEAPDSASVGSTLTFQGAAPPGDGLVTVDGSYDGGKTWETLSSVGSANGSYSAQVTLSRPGILQLRIVFADGSQATGSVNVT
jgi:hypothetical protein